MKCQTRGIARDAEVGTDRDTLRCVLDGPEFVGYG